MTAKDPSFLLASSCPYSCLLFSSSFLEHQAHLWYMKNEICTDKNFVPLFMLSLLDIRFSTGSQDLQQEVFQDCSTRAFIIPVVDGFLFLGIALNTWRIQNSKTNEA